MLCEHLLNLGVVKQLFLGHAQDFEGLFSRHEPTLDPETFLGHLLAACVAVFLGECLVMLLLEVLSHLVESLFLRDWSDVAHIWSFHISVVIFHSIGPSLPRASFILVIILVLEVIVIGFFELRLRPCVLFLWLLWEGLLAFALANPL